jgi:hypothetical protein
VTAVVAGCTNDPDINGSNVPPLGPSPTCADVCNRLIALCGFAPEGADCTTPDASGYCDMLTQDQLTCIGQTTSCEEAWDTQEGGCAFTPPPSDASTDDASMDDATGG